MASKRRQKRKQAKIDKPQGSAVSTAAPQEPSSTARHRFRRSIVNLAESVCASWQDADHLRKERRSTLQMYAGKGFNAFDDADMPDMAINVLHRAMSATAHSISAGPPAFEVHPVTTAGLRGYATLMSHLLTHRARESRMHTIERITLLEAMSSGAGFIKTGVAPTEAYDASVDDVDDQVDRYDPGRVYVSGVSAADMIIDATCRMWPDFHFVGHRFRTNRERLESILSATEIDRMPQWAERSRSGDEDSVRPGSRGSRDDQASFVTLYDAIELYIPAGVLSREPLTLLLPGDPENLGGVLEKGRMSDAGMLLRDPVEYDGPEFGPYSRLVFDEMPDTAWGLPMASFWKTLAKMIAALAEHVIDADITMRDVVAVGDGAMEKDIEALRTSRNQQFVRVSTSTLEAMKQFQFGGASERAHATLALYMQMFSRESGSTDLLSGSPISGRDEVTATEVDEVSSRLNQQLDAMEGAFLEHIDEVGRHMAFWLHNDPTLDLNVMLRAAGIDVPVRMTPETRGESDLTDYLVRVVRGSMRRKTERQKSREIMQFAGNVVPLAVQLAAATGGAFKATAFMQQVGRGILDPADIEEFWDDASLKVNNGLVTALLAQQSGASVGGGVQGSRNGGGRTGAPGAGMAMPNPGMPGTDGAPGSINTGSQSPNFGMG